MFSRAPGILLVVTVTALIYLFLVHRVLNRMRLSIFSALLILLAMLAGGFLPPIPLWRGLSINVGGALIPLGLVVYLVVTSDEAIEKVRGFAAATAAAIVVWGADRLLPINPGSAGYELDPLYLPAAIAGFVAYLLGRSRRASFTGGVLGILLLDLAAWSENLFRGFRDITIILGGAGIFDATLISGVLAALFAELVGEVRERVSGGPGEES